MMATAGPNQVRCFMYFYIKQVTLDGTIIYFNIKQCDGSKWLLLRIYSLNPLDIPQPWTFGLKVPPPGAQQSGVSFVFCSH
jgi:hypothetical protein